MSLALPARRRHGRGPRSRPDRRRVIVEGTEHVAAAGHRVYVVAYYRSPEDARDFRGGVVTTYADHDTAPDRVTVSAPGTGDWFVSILERSPGASGFTFVAGADSVPLVPR